MLPKVMCFSKLGKYRHIICVSLSTCISLFLKKTIYFPTHIRINNRNWHSTQKNIFMLCLPFHTLQSKHKNCLFFQWQFYLALFLGDSFIFLSTLQKNWTFLGKYRSLILLNIKDSHWQLGTGEGRNKIFFSKKWQRGLVLCLLKYSSI